MPGVTYVIYGYSSARATGYDYTGAPHWRKLLLQLLTKTG